MSDRPPTLPPCDLRSGAIEAIYAGRFAIISWDDLCATAVDAFGGRWEERIANLRHASRAVLDRAELDEAADTFETLLRAARGRLRKEIAHHALLSNQPLWGFLNGIALAERLHVNHLEMLLGRDRPGDRSPARRALGHAFRCHFARRALYREVFPVIEAVHAIDAAVRARRPRLLLAAFGTAYGKTAEAIARAGYDRIRARTLSMADVETIIASVLAPMAIVRDAWELVAIGPQAFESAKGTRAATASLNALAAGHPVRVRERSWSLPSFFAWYLPRGNGGLIPGIVRPKLAVAYARALLPVARGLWRRAPYSTTRADLPALWAHAPDGRGLILDPAALAYGARSLAHAGLENTNPLLPRDASAESGYAIDQYIIRKVAEHLADPEGVWADRLEDFLFRWTHASRDPALVARLRSTFRSIDPDIKRLAGAVLSAGENRLARLGTIEEDAWEMFLAARRRLLDAVDAEWRDERRGPLATVLGSYYIHGL